MKLLIKGGRVIDPADKVNRVSDILVENGRIKKVSSNIKAGTSKVETIDASGKVVIPGLIDMHVHLREPGMEDEETIASGTRAAARGGVTSVVCMANTNPVIDNQAQVDFILLKARDEGVVNVFLVGGVTKGLRGEELSEIGELKDAGVVAISDDGNPIMNTQIMRQALEYAKMFELPVISHCEDLNLSRDGAMNEGYMSTVLGLKGIPKEAEEIMVARDLRLAKMTGGILHIAHVSTAGSVDLIRGAKRNGIRVTCETAPHYFTLTEEAVSSFDTNTKMYPPLRTRDDVQAIREGLADGTIDCISSDHAPHLDVEKDQEYALAPFGIIGLETILPLIITELFDKNVLALSEAIAKMTVNPARILGLNRGTLNQGSVADITIIDLDLARTIDDKFASKSKNSPFIGRRLKGFAVATIVEGEVVTQG
jgi:dihydroorotase